MEIKDSVPGLEIERKEDDLEGLWIPVACIIIRTVVRIVGMFRMSHICNTKCSRLYSCSKTYVSLQTCLEALSDSILTAYKRKTHRNFPERQ